MALAAPAPGLDKRSWAPVAGQTYLNIGQNYANEWDAFASAVKTPAGISVYGNIYDGALTSAAQTLLSQYAGSHG